MNATTDFPAADAAAVLRPPALYEQVADLLRQRIFDHQLQPGAWVDEQALADAFGISRTPMREALKVLAAEGLVQLKPRRGCYVTQLSERDLDEIFPVLALLEARAAEEAVHRAAPPDIQRLDALQGELERFAADADVDRFFTANQDFHAAIQSLADNRWLSQLIEDSRRFIKLTRRDSLRVDGRIQQSLAEHRDILAAIKAGDAAAAAQHMHQHILSGRAALTILHERQS
ncbi:GntR family transcriptional regulator [bacterium]|nr:GntR family transcriptional regulator [bacterium]